MIIKRIVPICLIWVLLMTGCSDGEQSVENTVLGTESEAVVKDDIEASDMFTDRDKEVGYDEESCIVVTLDGDGAVCDSDAVEISDSTVTISAEGTYLLTGTLSDGMIMVDAGDAAKVQLILDGVTIANAGSAAIYVRSADKVFITTVEGSENTLSNGGTYTAIDENNIDAVLFSKSDITLNGSGTLTITAEAGHGIVSKDDLVMTSGDYYITAAEHGFSGKDSVRIAGGSYTIQSGKDGIHAENSEDESLGFLYIANGTFTITAEGDGLSAGAYMLIEDGSYTIETGGGSGNAVIQDKIPGVSDYAAESDETETVSAKGLKAGTELSLNGGSFTIDSADDALHSNGNLSVNGGSLQIAAGDDGVHADAAANISGGEITVSQSYEGIEGLSIDIEGGIIDITATDDGLNSAGGSDGSGLGGRGDDIFAVTEGAYISISGGTLAIDAAGDGIDSNGDFMVSGGETYVSGPVSSGNGILDYSGEADISGGIFVAAGSSEMAQNFGSASTQGVMMVTLDAKGAAGDSVILTDSDGNELVSWQSGKEFDCVIVSCPDITKGAEYTLAVGKSNIDVTMDSLVYGGMGSGGPGGEMSPGGGGERPDGQAPNGNAGGPGGLPSGDGPAM